MKRGGKAYKQAKNRKIKADARKRKELQQMLKSEKLRKMVSEMEDDKAYSIQDDETGRYLPFGTELNLLGSFWKEYFGLINSK